MKTLVPIIFYLITAICSGQQTVELSWHTSEETAKAEAEKTGKPIFMFFTAEWCHFCHTMEDETLTKPKVSQYLNENFTLLKLDYDESKDLVARYRIQGVPAMVIGDPTLKKVEKTSGFMPIDVFMAWLEMSGPKISPETIAAEKEAALQFLKDMSQSFRQGLTEDQYAAINEFYENFSKRDPQAVQFAKEQLSEEVKHNPGRFSRFLRDEKLHVRLLTANAFAKLYGKAFDYDPWDLSEENFTRLDAFLSKNNISSLLEDLIDF
ncbi:MAG: thioredoxin family protein [Verrucomicrobiales bacterium]|nr:thioredoxin family protein [Verrucomicrobiales bacterium]